MARANDAADARAAADVSGSSRPWRQRVVDRSLGRAAQRSVDRGGELVLAAAELLEQSNGDSFTVQDVADAAGVSLRTLYTHFDGKDDLLLAVYEEAMQAYARIIREAIADYDDPIDRLAGGVYFAGRLWERATRGVSIGASRLRARLVEVEPERLVVAQGPMNSLMLELVRAAEASGGLATARADAAAYLLVTLVFAFGQSHVLGPSTSEEPASVTELVGFVIRGLGGEVDEAWDRRFERRWAAMPATFSVAADLQPAGSASRGARARQRRAS